MSGVLPQQWVQWSRMPNNCLWPPPLIWCQCQQNSSVVVINSFVKSPNEAGKPINVHAKKCIWLTGSLTANSVEGECLSPVLGHWADVKQIARIPLGSSRHVLTRLDTFDVSSASSSSCRAVLFDKLDTAKMHGLDMWNVCRVETWRDELSGIWAYSNTNAVALITWVVGHTSHHVFCRSHPQPKHLTAWVATHLRIPKGGKAELA